MVPFESLGAVSYSPCVVTMALSCISSEINRDFSYLLHSSPPFRGFPSEYFHSVWYGKPRMVGLSDGKKTLRICVIVLTQYRRVTSDGQTDGQTDGRTSCHGIVRTMHTRRAVKTIQDRGLVTMER